jgi:hypothetical protein
VDGGVEVIDLEGGATDRKYRVALIPVLLCSSRRGIDG